MVSSTAEILSQSSLRVLNQSAYSVRKEHREGLSAIGYLSKKEGKFYIRPLSLPTLTLHQGLPAKWKKVFNENDNLKNWSCVYIDGYETKKIGNKKQQAYQENSFLHKEKPLSFFPKGKENRRYYAKLHPELEYMSIQDIGKNLANSSHLKIKQGGNTSFLLGQTLQAGSVPISPAELEKLKEKDAYIAGQYTPGFLFILGIDGREDQIPGTKTHEKFIPCPAGKEYKNIEIPKEVLENFISISQERKEASKNLGDAKQLPFLPKGYKEEKQGKGKDYWEPAHGELIYFDINNKGEISEISYSSIWRKKIKNDIYHSFKLINPDLLPWGNELRKPDKSGFTPAEALFGVVAEKKTDTGVNSYNLASRVRFSDAIATEPLTLMPAKPLKILASPKPPSPAMYFGAHNGYLKKSNPSANEKALDLEKHQPNGRKVYLHHPEQAIQQKKWETKNSDNLKQKISCQLIAKDQSLYYHIDFNNLSWDELSLLAKAINPDPSFSHRIGLGKPLGLGSVKNEICGLFLLDRIARYQSLDSPRYTRIKAVQNWDDESLSQLYPLETKAVLKKVKALDKAFNETLVDKNTLTTLTALGNRDAIPDTPVCYPYKHSNPDKQEANQENEGFKWFGENDESNSHRVLQAVHAGKIPTLKSN